MKIATLIRLSTIPILGVWVGFASNAESSDCRNRARVVVQRNAIATAVVVDANPVALSPIGFYRVGSDLRSEAAAQAIADRVEAILAERGIVGAAQKLGSASEVDESSSPSFAAWQISQKRCAACHDGSDEERLDLSDLDALSAEQKLLVLRNIYSGKMPKNGDRLTDDEVGVFVKWLGETK